MATFRHLRFRLSPDTSEVGVGKVATDVLSTGKMVKRDCLEKPLFLPARRLEPPKKVEHGGGGGTRCFSFVHRRNHWFKRTAKRMVSVATRLIAIAEKS